ncbi:MAG TPA: TetR/AcrR family transcriptional regulator [Acidimicrobiales bacterium]
MGPSTELAERYLTADDVERRLVDAALRCVERWGLAKTSIDDIAREAGIGRATVYRLFPGGKDRLVAAVLQHELGRLFHEADSEAKQATDLEDLVCTGVGIAMRTLTTNAALCYLLVHEPEAILPHFAFHRLDPLLATVAELSRPHLARFLPDEAVRPAAELLARVVLAYSFDPVPELDPTDPDSLRRFVRTYLLPALTTDAHRTQERR